MTAHRPFTGSKRLVVKVGTSTLTYPSGKLNLYYIERLVRELADLRNNGREIVLVTSGAVGAGLGRLGISRRGMTIPEKQAMAAVGQGILIRVYEELFAHHGLVVAQVLLTREDVSDRKRYVNSRNTLLTLVERLGVVPIVNENDTVAADEIRFGDNDTLSALVAVLVDADLLVILSDTDGLFTGDPRRDEGAKLVPEVREITAEIEAMAQGRGTEGGTGGMRTKLAAARITMGCGVQLVVANASAEWAVRRVLEGEDVGTWFASGVQKLHTRQRWIAYGAPSLGKVAIDAGAVRAIVFEGKSLLPSGILAVDGAFDQGHTVSLTDGVNGQEVARGIVNYSSDEVARIKGRKTAEIARVLGYKLFDEVVHRDNLVVTAVVTGNAR